MTEASTLRLAFQQRFEAVPHVARAPGRVNLIGEHTDYNGGRVMPAALSFHSWVAAAPRRDGRIAVHSEQFNETVECELARIRRHDVVPRAAHWADYPLGVAACLLDAGVVLPGANLMIRGNVPLGAGLSSSASLEVATAGALLAMASRTFEPVQLALLCQRAENDYVGMRCGIMDQYTAVMGRENFALELDCQRLTHRLIPISFEQAHPGERARLVLCDSLRKHELAASEYNRRRLECESALAALQPRLPTVRSLSGLSIAQLNAHATLLNDVQLRRARHVISENERVRLAAEALLAGELVQAGQLMYASHESLRDDYEVSCLELDCLVTAARESPGTYGARMTGGGFGGCTVNLVREDSIDRFERHVNLRYRETFGLEPRIYHCRSADGLRLEHAA